MYKVPVGRSRKQKDKPPALPPEPQAPERPPEPESLSVVVHPPAEPPVIDGIAASVAATIQQLKPPPPSDVVAFFIKALYDGTPFTYRYEVIPDVFVTFRELSMHELQICRKEASVDPAIGEFLAAIAEYENKATSVTYSLDSVKDMSYDTKNATPIPELLAWVSDNLFHTAGLFEAAKTKYEEFKKLVESLYEAARNPDFFVQSRSA